MNVLAIGAHFDDIELGCGGSIARHVAEGDKVFAYVATMSGFKNPTDEVVRSNESAKEEGCKAIKILGAELICDAYEVFQLEFREDLNAKILNIVENMNIEKVYTHWTGDIHHDHYALAKASLHSCRHVPRMLMYRSNWYHSAQDFRGTFYVDITDTWHIKEQAIKAHKSEFDRVGSKWVEFFKNEAENAGQKIGVKYAEVFEIVKWLE